MRLLVVAAVVAACTACNARPERIPLTFDRMRDQPRYNAYGRSSYFDDGMMMRRPPAGTVAVGAAASEAVSTLTAIPIPISAEIMQRGRNRYDAFCRPCHDVDGSADSPVAKNMQLRPPPSLLEPRLRQLPVGRIYQTIAIGYGLMPSYAYQLPPDDRWAVVAYVRALQLRSGFALNQLPPPLRDEARRSLPESGR